MTFHPEPSGPQRSYRHLRPDPNYRVVPGAAPRRVRIDSDGMAWGEVPVEPVSNGTSNRLDTGPRTAIHIAISDQNEERDTQHHRAIRDVEGYDLRPDPLEARTPAEFIDALRRFRRWAGEPSFRKMENRSLCSAATYCNLLNSNALPKFTVLNAFIIACGGDEEEFARWATAWRRFDQGDSVTRPPIVLLPPNEEQNKAIEE